MSDEQGIRAVADALYTMAERVMDAPTTLEIVPTAPAELPAAMVQMLPGDPVRKRYKNGDWVGVQRWALYLRVAVRDMARVDDTQLKNTGANGVVRNRNEVQVIYGVKVGQVRSRVDNWLAEN